MLDCTNIVEGRLILARNLATRAYAMKFLIAGTKYLSA